MPAKSQAALAKKRLWRKEYDQGRPVRRSKRGGSPQKGSKRSIVGLDGEGVGMYPHRYTMLTWAHRDGTGATLRAPPGGRLGTNEILDWLDRTLPHQARVFGFSLNYDWTKILEDLDNRALYLLEHREKRPFKNPKNPGRGRRKICWGEWVLDRIGTKFSFRRRHKRGKKYHRSHAIWDVWKFSGMSFVATVEAWKLATPEELEVLRDMKSKRGTFTDSGAGEVEKYNRLECALLAKFGYALLQACRDAGVPLRQYYGPGTIAKAMLTQMVGGRKYFEKLREKLRDPELLTAIASAFFGGRFENRIIGAPNLPLWEADVNSAYPYEVSRLPCLQHGQWVKTKREPKAGLFLARYRLEKTKINFPWGPFPFRHDDGAISFPIESGGGWVWSPEWLAGRNWPSKNVRFLEAWCWRPSCKCKLPFRRVAEWYAERLAVGKTSGKGWALKRGMNSCYGVLAQSVGRAPFQSWVYAGLITSGLRAKMLDIILRHRNSRNLYSIATDGIVTREKLGLVDSAELGAWEVKRAEVAPWYVRPGMAFGLKPKSRGIALTQFLALEKTMKAAWNKSRSLSTIVVAPPSTRFLGMKQGIWIKPRTGEYVRSKFYGTWHEAPRILSFDPLPKRDGFESGSRKNLRVRRLAVTLESLPYGKAGTSKDAEELRSAAREAEDQPDFDD